MASIGGEPGKLVTRLLRDLLDYDARYKHKPGSNVLADPAPRYQPANGYAVVTRGEKECVHTLCRKDGQSSVPDITYLEPKMYKSASYCSTCFWHYDVIVNLGNTKPVSQLCHLSAPEFKMHHFILEGQETRTVDEARYAGDTFNTWVQKYSWRCSAPTCSITCQISIAPPKLTEEMRKTLFDHEILEQRGNSIIRRYPERYLTGSRPPKPGAVRYLLYQYLRNARAQTREDEPKRVAARNKNFLLSFGDDCDDVLQSIGFTIQYDDRGEPECAEKFFLPPLVQKPEDVFSAKTLWTYIDDIFLELCQLIVLTPPEDMGTGKPIAYTPAGAFQDIKVMLGIGDMLSRRTIAIDGTHEHPYYASLGATEDLVDELVVYAYQRQKACDPSNTPYYYECLREIMRGRGNSDAISMEIALAESSGQQTQTRIDEAYHNLGVDSDADDNHIIGTYHSRVESAPLQADAAKADLEIIGRVRKSSKIIEIATMTRMDYNAALRFLGLEVVPDADVETIRAAVVAASDTDKNQLIQALRVIAENRQGADLGLNLFISQLESGENGHGMSVQDAYHRLQIHDHHISEELILHYYRSLTQDAPPGSRQSFLEALSVIARDRGSQYLTDQVNNPDSKIPAPAAQPDQPVGLANIGNTCYLNSLLQYFYTVKAVREVVMNFIDYRMEATEESVAKKRVGGRAVRREEIVRAQEFIVLLAGLYTQLKTASSRAVKPSQDLAEKTLYSQERDEQFRRQSMSAIEPKVSTMNQGPDYVGPMPSPIPPNRPPPAPIMEDIEMSDKPESGSVDDGSSDITLVNPASVMIDDGIDGDTIPLLPRDKMSTISVAELTSDDAIDFDPFENDAVMITPMHTPPRLPTPRASTPDKFALPPRPNKPLTITIKTSGNPSKAAKLEFGAQQDVAEVIGNVMFNLECAIRPTAIEDITGEQIDVIRETFFGSTAVYLKKFDAVPSRKAEAWRNLIVYPDSNSSRTIYEALDIVFDEQIVEVDNAKAISYCAINKLPPVLQIQIQRTGYNPVTGPFKNQNRIEFDETIFLDRYMDHEKVLARRNDSEERKARLRTLTTRKANLQQPVDRVTALSDARDWLQAINSDPELYIAESLLTNVVEQKRLALTQELEEIELECVKLRRQIREDFTDMREHRYALQAVFMHIGEAGSGHHWVYIYDFKCGVWREYNDERVEIVRDRKVIFDPTGDRRATAHYLVYVRDDMKDDLVDAVYRDMIPEPSPEIQEMPYSFDIDHGSSAKDLSDSMHVENADFDESQMSYDFGRNNSPEPEPRNKDTRPGEERIRAWTGNISNPAESNQPS